VQIMLEDITVYNDIRERLAQITPHQIEAAHRKLSAGKVPPEDLIGVIENQSTKALYALWHLLEAESELEKAKAKGSSDENEEDAHRQNAALASMFEGVVGELFWAQARIDLGYYVEHDVGLRSGWRLVKEHRKTPAFLASLLAGGQI
jgi:hypothetical protein